MLPKCLDRKTIYKSKWINLYADKVSMPSGKIIEKYHFLDYPQESIVVLLINKANRICLIKSLRYTTQKLEWELPAGGITRGEDVLKASAREVIEETGFKTKELHCLYKFNPSNGMSNQTVHVVSGKITDDLPKDFDTDEVKNIHWLSIEQIKNLIAKNEINDGTSLIPLLIYLNSVQT